MEKIKKIIRKVNNRITKSMPKVSVERGIMVKTKEELIFKMRAETPYGRVEGDFFMSPDLKDESTIAEIISWGLIEEITNKEEKN